MNHFSMGGTTCWCCGHPIAGMDKTTFSELVGKGEKKKLETYRSCRNCRHSIVDLHRTRIQTCDARNADISGMKAMLRGEGYVAKYWTQGALVQRVTEHQGYAPAILDQLQWKEYDDPFAKDSHAKVVVDRKQYDKDDYAKRRIATLEKRAADAAELFNWEKQNEQQ